MGEADSTATGEGVIGYSKVMNTQSVRVSTFDDRLVAKLIHALLTQTQIPVADVADHAGILGAAGLRAETHRLFGCSPTQLRRDNMPASRRRPQAAVIRVDLPVTGAYDFEWVFDYLCTRALQGIEEVQGRCYRRRVSEAGKPLVWLTVSQHDTGLQVVLPLTCGPACELLSRVVRLFDVRVDGDLIDRTLLGAPSRYLKQSVAQAPGLRVPGAWDGFETAVRAVLGQQVSVARGTELANRMVQAYGEGDFPAPDQLRHQEIAELGMPGNRGRAISTLAEWVDVDGHTLLEGQACESFVQGLGAIKGIGPWTQNYMRLRVVKDVDAFPHNDWVVLKQLKTTPTQALKLADCWRPWRAYALMHIWRLAGLQRKASEAMTRRNK